MKILRPTKTILLWCTTIFFVLAAFAFFPSVSSIIGLMVALLLAPIQKVKQITRRFLRPKWLRVLAITVLIIVFFATAPTTQTEEHTTQEQPSQTITQDIPDAREEHDKITPQEAPPKVEETPEKAPTEEEAPEEEPPAEDTPEEAAQEDEANQANTTDDIPAVAPAPIPEAAPAPEQQPEADPVVEQDNEPGIEYVLNTSSRKFHYPHCGSVDTMKDHNKGYYTGTRDEVIAQGYEPCGRCAP